MDGIPVFEEVADSIFLLKSPFGTLWSGIYLVKRKRPVLIDSGADAATVDECLLPALSKLGLGLNNVELLLCTHTHGDHIGGHFRLKQLAPQLKTPTFRGSLAKLRDPLEYSKLIRAKFPQDSPPPPPVLKGVEPDILLDEGSEIDTGSGVLRLLHAPGHDDDCVCFHDEATKTLISGDSLQGNGTPFQGLGFYQDLSSYRGSLRKLRAMAIERLAAGHGYLPFGNLVEGRKKVDECLEECLSLTELYDKFLDESWTAGLREPHELAKALLESLGAQCPKFLFLALQTTMAHLKTRPDFAR